MRRQAGMYQRESWEGKPRYWKPYFSPFIIARAMTIC